MQAALEDVRESLSVPGSPVPFIASSPGEPPTNWYGNMLFPEALYLVDDTANVSDISMTLVSDAMDLTGTHHFSADAEFGHWWDGKAYDPVDGQIKQVAPPHDVAPRPFMRPGFALMKQRVEARAAQRLMEEVNR
jgi:hypothetical protein